MKDKQRKQKRLRDCSRSRRTGATHAGAVKTRRQYMTLSDRRHLEFDNGLKFVDLLARNQG